MEHDAAFLRQQSLNKLRAAIAFATAGEIERAALFLDFAREVRSGKRRLRSATKAEARRRNTQRYGYYGTEND